MKRGGPLKRGKSLSRGTKALKRGGPLARTARLRQVGKRGRATRKALDAARTVVLERAGGRCERCAMRARLELHHLLSRARGGSHKPANLAALCRRCHDLVTVGHPCDLKRWRKSTKGGPVRTSRGPARDLSLRAGPRFDSGGGA